MDEGFAVFLIGIGVNDWFRLPSALWVLSNLHGQIRELKVQCNIFTRSLSAWHLVFPIVRLCDVQGMLCIHRPLSALHCHAACAAMASIKLAVSTGTVILIGQAREWLPWRHAVFGQPSSDCAVLEKRRTHQAICQVFTPMHLHLLSQLTASYNEALFPQSTMYARNFCVLSSNRDYRQRGV